MRRRYLWLALSVLVVAGCAGGVGTTGSTDSSPGESTTSSPPATASTTSTTTAATTTIPADAVPVEMQGVWKDVSGFYQLTLRGTSYVINGLSGQVSVDGDEIEFYGHSGCAGSGTYMWVREGDTMTFTATTDDPCPRSDALDEVTYEFFAAAP